MSYTIKILILTICIAASSRATKDEIVSVRIETCRGCSLNRLPEVKKFVMEDAPLYDRVEVKFITGAAPEALFLDAAGEEVQRIVLSHLTRQECNEVLMDRGFTKKNNNEEF